MTRAIIPLALAACGSVAPEPLPPVARATRPRAAATIAPPAAHACLPAIDAPAIARLDADANAIHVCFAHDACFAIDRRTSAIARTDRVESPAPRLAPDALTIDHGAIGATGSPDRVSTGIADAGGDDFLMVGAGRHTGDPPRVLLVDRYTHKTRELPTVSTDPCQEAAWVGNDVLVTTHDCEGGHAFGTLYQHDGTPIGLVGGAHPIDTVGAFAVIAPQRAAIVAPRGYALVLLDLPLAKDQTVIDLVPIQAQSTPAPQFAAVPSGTSDFLVASSTGGVAIVDGTRAEIARSWIIPRCDDAAASGP